MSGLTQIQEAEEIFGEIITALSIINMRSNAMSEGYFLLCSFLTWKVRLFRLGWQVMEDNG